MSEGQGRVAWSHTSTLLALIKNVNRDPKKDRAVKAYELNPYENRGRIEEAIPIESMGELKSIFVKDGG